MNTIWTLLLQHIQMWCTKAESCMSKVQQHQNQAFKRRILKIQAVSGETALPTSFKDALVALSTKLTTYCLQLLRKNIFMYRNHRKSVLHRDTYYIYRG